MVNGKQKGCKKILVLYTNFGKNRKPEKTNWVMHQYHLGQHEEEREGELVVSKIFYQTQPRQCNWSERTTGVLNTVAGEGNSDLGGSKEMRDDLSAAVVNVGGGGGAAPPPPIPSYGAIDQFGFLPFRKSFDEVCG